MIVNIRTEILVLLMSLQIFLSQTVFNIKPVKDTSFTNSDRICTTLNKKNKKSQPVEIPFLNNRKTRVIIKIISIDCCAKLNTV